MKTTTPNFFGVHRSTYLRTIPYRTHGKCQYLGLECVIAREINTGEWAVLEVESGLRFGHAYDSKQDAITATNMLIGNLTSRQIAKGLAARKRTMRLSAKAQKESA